MKTTTKKTIMKKACGMGGPTAPSPFSMIGGGLKNLGNSIKSGIRNAGNGLNGILDTESKLNNSAGNKLKQENEDNLHGGKYVPEIDKTQKKKVIKGVLKVNSYRDNPNNTTTNLLSDGSTSTVKYKKNKDGSLQPSEVSASPTLAPYSPKGFTKVKYK